MKKYIIFIFFLFFCGNYIYAQQPSLESLADLSVVAIGRVENKFEYQTVDVNGQKIYGVFVNFHVERYLKFAANKVFEKESNIIIFSEGQSDTRDCGFQEAGQYLVFLSEFVNPPEQFSRDAVYIIEPFARFEVFAGGILSDNWGVFTNTKKSNISVQEAIDQIEEFLN